MKAKHVKHLAQSRWPHVAFTGGSSIHASRADSVGTAWIDPHDPRFSFRNIRDSKATSRIWNKVTAMFGDMEFLLDYEQFRDMLLLDFSLLAEGKPTHRTHDRLKNPTTGNRFHRIALSPPFVGGIRVWFDMPYQSSKVHLFFRFRLETPQENHDKIRAKAAEKIKEVELEMETVYETMGIVAEPPKEEGEKVKVLEQ